MVAAHGERLDSVLTRLPSRLLAEPTWTTTCSALHEIIEETRRPLLVERHRDALDEMEQSISPAFISGESNHPRLARLISELEEDSERQRIASTITTIATDEHYVGIDLRSALIEFLCLLRERQGIEIAALQLHVIGVYRQLFALIQAGQGLRIELEHLRTLPAEHLQRLPGIGPDRPGPEFGCPELPAQLVWSTSLVQRTMQEANDSLACLAIRPGTKPMAIRSCLARSKSR